MDTPISEFEGLDRFFYVVYPPAFATLGYCQADYSRIFPTGHTLFEDVGKGFKKIFQDKLTFCNHMFNVPMIGSA